MKSPRTPPLQLVSAPFVAVPLVAVLLLAGCKTMNLENADQVGRTLTPGVAFSLLRDTPQTTILDLRNEGDFHGPLGHLARARSLSIERLASSQAWLAAFGDTTVLTYCAQTCSAELVEELTTLGLETALVLEGGIEAWVDEGYGTVHEFRGGPPCS